MDPLPYNITLSSQTATISYFPSREGPIETGWNTTYPSGGKEVGPGTLLEGIGVAYHRTTHAGATLEFEWVGTAVYLYGKANAGSYSLSVDGKSVESPSDDVPLGALLGFKANLEYGSHTVKLMVLGEAEVVFQNAEVTIGIGYIGNTLQNRTMFATDEKPSLRPNPFFQFGGSKTSKSWIMEPAPQTVYHVNGSTSQIARQMMTCEFDNTLSFNFSQASAFILWGAVNYDHSSKRAMITWDGGQKDTRLNDISDYLDFQQIIYWEGGLDRDKNYTVQISNEVDTHRRIDLTADTRWPAFGFSRLELIDGGPAPNRSTNAGEPSPTGQYTSSPRPETLTAGTLTAGVLAGIVVGSVVVSLLLGVAGFLLWKWHYSRRQNKESRYGLIFTPFPQHLQASEGTGTRSSSSRLNINAPPTIRETDAGSVQSTLPPEYQSDYSIPRAADYQPQARDLAGRGPDYRRKT
ncbi:hypothetical protein PM082_014861 [Marasmius tenuissimus]|nr:hypothetical protein PM082_014861 [Marasmius tenuissimus]